MQVVAKFKVESFALQSDEARVLKLRAVYDSDPNSPNASWSKWTPSGELTMTITNPSAYNQFEVGAEYMLTFDRVTPPAIA